MNIQFRHFGKILYRISFRFFLQSMPFQDMLPERWQLFFQLQPEIIRREQFRALYGERSRIGHISAVDQMNPVSRIKEIYPFLLRMSECKKQGMFIDYGSAFQIISVNVPCIIQHIHEGTALIPDKPLTVYKVSGVRVYGQKSSGAFAGLCIEVIQRNIFTELTDHPHGSRRICCNVPKHDVFCSVAENPGIFPIRKGTYPFISHLMQMAEFPFQAYPVFRGLAGGKITVHVAQERRITLLSRQAK